MWFPILIIAVLGYLLGNLNGAVCVSNRIAHEDVRDQGSGNAGLTNFIRNYGAANSIFVILIDGGKALLACLIGSFLMETYGMKLEGLAIGGLAVMVGHDFPALLDFKGGKGILSGCVIAFVIDWKIGLVILGVFLVVYLLTQYVSLASVLGSIALGVGFVVFHRNNLTVMLCGVAMSVLAVYMHRSNILRLLQGQERKTNLFGKGEKR